MIECTKLVHLQHHIHRQQIPQRTCVRFCRLKPTINNPQNPTQRICGRRKHTTKYRRETSNILVIVKTWQHHAGAVKQHWMRAAALPFVAVAILAQPITSSATPTSFNELVLPISFGLPSNRFIGNSTGTTTAKRRDFALIIPGVGDTYVYGDEQSYYQGYQEARYAITFKKAGWDCLRHYEILGAGSVPFFLNISQIPPHTMTNFPTELVRQLMTLPGVPSEQSVQHHIQQHKSTDGLKIDMALFDELKYEQLRQELFNYAAQKLSWRALGERFLAEVGTKYPCLPPQPKGLFVAANGSDYQSEITFGGLYEVLGNDMSSLSGYNKGSFRIPTAKRYMYGGGFSYSNVFDLPHDLEGKEALLQERLETGAFDVIVATTIGPSCAVNGFRYKNKSVVKIIKDYQQRYNPLIIIVDGTDFGQCPNYFKQLFGAKKVQFHLQFIREYDAALDKGYVPPMCWGKCGACPDAHALLAGGLEGGSGFVTIIVYAVLFCFLAAFLGRGGSCRGHRSFLR